MTPFGLRKNTLGRDFLVWIGIFVVTVAVGTTIEADEGAGAGAGVGVGALVLIAGAAGRMGMRPGIPATTAETMETTEVTRGVIELVVSRVGISVAVMTGVRTTLVVVTAGIVIGIEMVGTMLVAVAFPPPGERKMSFWAPSRKDQDAWYPNKAKKSDFDRPRRTKGESRTRSIFVSLPDNVRGSVVGV